MSDDGAPIDFPWGDYFKVSGRWSAYAVGAIFGGLALLARAQMNQERREAERNRPRWTDENRFDTRPRR